MIASPLAVYFPHTMYTVNKFVFEMITYMLLAFGMLHITMLIENEIIREIIL